MEGKTVVQSSKINTYTKPSNPEVDNVSSTLHSKRNKNAPKFPNVDPNIKVKKRNGSFEKVDPLQVLLKVASCAEGLENIDSMKIATKALDGIFDGVSTADLDSLLIQCSAMLISEEPEYSKLAARLLDVYIAKNVYLGVGIESFYNSICIGYNEGLIAEDTYKFVCDNAVVLNEVVKRKRSKIFEYFGLRTVHDRYLLRHPTKRFVIETPQYFFMRVACGLAKSVEDAIEFYNLISSFEYLPSTPTLFNSGTKHPQMSSCYLLDSPKDSIGAIYDNYKDIALLSKYAGGVGVAYHRIRSRDSLIKGTNGQSKGIIPFLKTLDSSVSAVNQGGKRKGACCVYLETWHADIYDFLVLRNNTGDEASRTHNLNLANWIPDLFMQRVKNNEQWSLFDPSVTPELCDLYGSEFNDAYKKAETDKLFIKQVPARDLYSLMIRTLAQTGNGWMTFKDACNLKSNQTGKKENVIHLSNLCTEILEVTSESETAVCNLGSINLARYVKDDKSFDYEKLAKNIKIAIRYLDRVVDINFYPINKASDSNNKWRPVGLGVMGFQDLLFKCSLSFDSKEAMELAATIQEEIYYYAIQASCKLAQENGAHDSFKETKAAKALLQFDLWDHKVKDTKRWDALKKEIKKHGLRNSLVIAIAPTATIASIAGSYECIEPQVSNLFKRETLSGEFLQINAYLVNDLRKHGIWNSSIRAKIKLNEGSIQNIDEIPDNVKKIYRTAWELPQKVIIDLAKARGPFIDQSQSVNLFVKDPTIGKLSSMYAYAWEQGLKTTYYLRSKSATRINQTTASTNSRATAEAVACSLENPESCESCS